VAKTLRMVGIAHKGGSSHLKVVTKRLVQTRGLYLTVIYKVFAQVVCLSVQ
jgi:hypothetical protein